MSLFRRNARRDANEPQIVELLERAGCSVERLSLPHGPDLLCGLLGKTVLLEVKTEKGRLQPGQLAWHRRWKGSPVVTVRTVDEALTLVGKLRVL
jgi:Holliday junction resolvase